MSWIDYVTAGGFAVATAAAILAYRQLVDGKQLARSQFILAIDSSLAPFEDLHQRINANHAWTAKSRAEKVEMRPTGLVGSCDDVIMAVVIPSFPMNSNR